MSPAKLLGSQFKPPRSLHSARASHVASTIVRTPRCQRCIAIAAERQKKAGPPPPPQPAEEPAPAPSQEATNGPKAAADAAVGNEPASEQESGQEDGSKETAEQLAAAERLLLAVKAGDLEDAEILAEATVAEAQALAAAVEAAEADKNATVKTLDTLKDQYRRLQADFDNYRNRAADEKKQSGSRAKMGLMESLLPLVDNFEMAAQQVKPSTEGEEKIDKSYQSLYRQMVDIFRSLGLEAVPTEGSPFDPEVHDAIMREESNDVEDGIILQEFRKGFQFGGKLVRPAMVKVAVSSKDALKSSEQEPVEQ